MIKQYNFILDNRLIAVQASDLKTAEILAYEIAEQLKELKSSS